LVAARGAPTGLFCQNDVIALGLLRGLAAGGLSVPGDVSLVGYDDLPFVSQVSPSLTTVRQPAAELGRAAAELLLGERDPDHRHRQVVLRPELNVRASTAQPRAARR
ncbi:MAG: substrate-binding domain-containing protein, partial [Streptomyces sp.]|nr:substrate-binding domain-containing protein [Streptomyces sp.]